MKRKLLLIFIVLSVISGAIKAQVHSPIFDIKFSRLFATYEFIRQLSDSYPENKYKEIYRSSEFNTDTYNLLLSEFDVLNTYESYQFQAYPNGQKFREIRMRY